MFDRRSKKEKRFVFLVQHVENKNQVFSIQYYIRYFVLTLVDRHDIHHVQVCSSHYQVLWTGILIFLESKSITLDDTNPKRCLQNHQMVSIKYHFPANTWYTLAIRIATRNKDKVRDERTLQPVVYNL